MLQRTLLVLLIATCTLSSGCATSPPCDAGPYVLVPGRNRNRTRRRSSPPKSRKTSASIPQHALQAYVRRVTEGLLKAPRTYGTEAQ